jgi:hypothetical protein
MRLKLIFSYNAAIYASLAILNANFSFMVSRFSVFETVEFKIYKNLKSEFILEKKEEKND